jgi:hypothetical protein
MLMGGLPMDNRPDVGLPECAEVDLQFPGHDCIYARTRDVSDTGMFVETEAARLPPHAMVKVRVWTKPRRSSFSLMGIITRRTARGVDVMYLCGTEAANEKLRAWASGVQRVDRSSATV